MVLSRERRSHCRRWSVVELLTPIAAGAVFWLAFGLVALASDWASDRLMDIEILRSFSLGLHLLARALVVAISIAFVIYASRVISLLVPKIRKRSRRLRKRQVKQSRSDI